MSSPIPVADQGQLAGGPGAAPPKRRPIDPLAAVHLLVSSPHMVASWAFLLVAVLIFGELGVRTGAGEWLAFRRDRKVVEGTWDAPPGTVLAPGEVRYRFLDPRGRVQHRVQRVVPEFAERLRERKGFSVVFPADAPRLARIAGSRRERIPYWPALCLVAGLMLVYGVYRFLASLDLVLDRLRLLRTGFLARGYRLRETPEFFLPFFPRHLVTFEFADPSGIHHRVHSETLHPERGRELVEEILFYDPEDLDDVVSQGSLPASIMVREDGLVELSRHLPLLKGFALAMLCLGAILGYLTFLAVAYL